MGLKIHGFAPQLQFSKHTGSPTWERSVARLSSGQRINSGSDDASGLTVSEKLRSQIRGLTRAMANTQDAISMIQTADSGLMEAQARLNRIRELSIQAQDDAHTTSDRLEIQKEVDQLVSSIDHIAQTTEFNQRHILDGSSSAVVTTSTEKAQAYVNPAGETLPLAGNYHVTLKAREYGTRQIQSSAAMQSSLTQEGAKGSSRLSSLTNFPQKSPESTLKIKGNWSETAVHLSASMSLDQVARTIQNAILDENGLDLQGSIFEFDETSGQFFFTSGYAGERGRVEFLLGEEPWETFMAMQITQKASEPSYRLEAYQGGQKIGKALSSGVGAEIIEGLKLDFPPPVPAMASVHLEHINPEFEPFTISITSTNTQSGYVPDPSWTGATNAGKAIIQIEPRAGQTFADIISAISLQIQATAPNMGLQVSISGSNVFVVAPELGSSSSLRVVTNKAAAYLFSQESDPPTDFTLYGTGGTPGRLVGTNNISGGINVTAPFQIRFRDADGILASSPLFGPGNLSYNDLMVQTNAALDAAGARIILEDRLGNGTFQAYSTDNGDDTVFQMEIHVPEKHIEVNSEVRFTVGDSDANNSGAVPATQRVNIVIPTGTYSLNEIENLFQAQMDAVPAATRPSLTAKFRDDFDGQNNSGSLVRNGLIWREGAGDFMLAIQDNQRGTNSRLEITNANGAANSIFGITNGVRTGSGGGGGRSAIGASGPLRGSLFPAPSAFDLRLIDDDGNEALIPFPTGASLVDDNGFGGTDIVSYINANRGAAQVEAYWNHGTNQWNLGASVRQTGLSANSPLPMDMNLRFRETSFGVTRNIDITIPAGTNLRTFDWSTVNLGALGVTLSNNGGRLRLTPDAAGVANGGYNYRMFVLNPQVEERNEAWAHLGVNLGSRVALRSRSTGSGTQFGYQIQATSPADATYIGQTMFRLSGSYGSLYGQNGYGRLASAGPATNQPTRAGNGDDYYDAGESPNWTDTLYSQRARFTPAGYSVNRNASHRPAGAASLVHGAVQLRTLLGISPPSYSNITAEAHNSDTAVLKATPGTVGPAATAAAVRLFPVPITIVKGTEYKNIHVKLDNGDIVEVSLTQALPPNGLVVGRNMDELEEALHQSLDNTNVNWKLDKENLRIDFMSDRVGDRSYFGLSTAYDETGKRLDWTHYQGYGIDEFDVQVKSSPLRFQTGANASQATELRIGSITSQALGLSGLSVTHIPQATQTLGKIDRALNAVSSARAGLGSFQNGLEHTAQSLEKNQIHSTMSESRIRDAEIATESIIQFKEETKMLSANQILGDVSNITRAYWNRVLNS